LGEGELQPSFARIFAERRCPVLSSLFAPSRRRRTALWLAFQRPMQRKLQRVTFNRAAAGVLTKMENVHRTRPIPERGSPWAFFLNADR